MAPYDSDSSDDEDAGSQSYTETNVLLGYADPEDQQNNNDDAGGGAETISRLGGRPDWLTASSSALPSANLARCGVCQALLVLLLQLNGELPDRFPGHERRLYVLACRNKACRRQAGSVRVIRGVSVDAATAEAAATAAEKAKTKKAADKKAETKTSTIGGTAPGLGESLFGVGNPFSSGAAVAGAKNPFALGSATAAAGAKNPFSLGGSASSTTAAPAAAPAAPSSPAAATPSDAATRDLPKTFAETLSLGADDASKQEDNVPTAAQPPAPWPPIDTWPAAYPISWIADAEYETLDPTPAAVPGVAADRMEVDDGSGSGSGGGKEDKYVFESSMDAAFQKFADRVAQNPDQVIRYEFGGQPLFYNKDDSVARLWGAPSDGSSNSKITTAPAATATSSARLPPCPNCGSRRVFEVQLMPHAIDLLEADELGLEGMDWGTVLVGVCEKDCQARGVRPGEASYLEEWVGVQWEELQGSR